MRQTRGALTAIGVALAIASSSSRAQPTDISELVRPICARHNVPGLIGAIVKIDGTTAIGSAGVRKVGSPEPFTTNDQIHIGSDTKAMTAALIAQLIEAGQLSYDTTLAEAFPDLASPMDAALSRVTVQQLLQHRGGVPANVDWGSYARRPGSVQEQRRQMVADVLRGKPAAEPGTRYLYSNVGYAILGAVVEAKTHGSWEDAIRARLFKPLGMTSAGFGPPGARGQVDQPWGHVLRPDGSLQPVQTDNAPPLGPAGRVHCTMADWARFVAWTLRCSREDTPLLSRAAQARLMTPLADSEYAGGWILTTRPWAGGTTWTHAGSNTTWYCVAWLAPERGFAVLAATNVAGADASQACDELSAALIAEHARTSRAASQPAS